MEKELSILPVEIKIIIIDYLYINYKFDEDCVYFYSEPNIFILNNQLVINFSTWFGTRSPNDYNPCEILHIDYERPYPIELEKIFGEIAKEIYKNTKKFKLRQDILELSYGKTSYAGTYGPLKKGFDSDTNIKFNILSNTYYCYSTLNILEYFKEMNIIDNDINEINDNIMIDSIKKLEDNIIKSVIESIKNYNKNIRNNIEKPILKIFEYKGDYKSFKINNKKIFFKLCKPNCIEKEKIKKNLIEEFNVY